MTKRNPYEDYDAIDPWKDDTGEFTYVEDPYESPDLVGDDGFGYTDPQHKVSAPARGGTESFPRTMVRPRYGDQVPVVGPEAIPVDSTARQPVDSIAPQRSKLLRRKKPVQVQEAPPQQGYTYDPRHAAPQPLQPAPPRRYRQRRPRKKHGCLVSLLVIVALVVGVYWLVAHPIDQKLAFSSEEQQTVDGTLSLYVPGTPYYVLALGSDAREGEAASRTDTMMLVRVDLIAAKLTLVSIPRDTKVQIAGQGTQKINAAYAFGGAGGAVRAVSELMGVPINHVAVVHFEELAGLVDYLGGVTVNVPVAVYDPYYTGLMLEEGTQTLDGQTALLWARSRYGYDRGDFQRQDNQRILLTAIMNRMLSLSPSEMPGALDCIGELIGTDLRCYNLVPLFLRLKLSNPTVYSCAVPSTTSDIDGVSYVIADEEALSELMRVVNSGGDPSVLTWE